MRSISLADAVDQAFNSLIAGRLAILVGAGLSMGGPTNLRSAAAIALDAKAKYDAIHGADRPPLSQKIEEQAQFFFDRGELATVYLRTFVDPDEFAGQPNAGHYAVADLLLTRAVSFAVTTNVDFVVETAGQMLLGHVGAGIDRNAVVQLPQGTSPYLKIHGCRLVDPSNTVWAPGQLATEPVASRIAGSAEWLTGALLNRDVLIVGYWTDWDYLNRVLEQTLGQVNPANVLVVNLSDASEFAAKAPDLYLLGHRAQSSFSHVRASAADFLAAVRLKFSKSFLRRLLHAAVPEFTEANGAPPDPTWTEAWSDDNQVLWAIRRDMEGCDPNEPAKAGAPPNEPLLGQTILQLRAAGAIPEGSYWVLNGQRIRVIRAPNKVLHRMQATFARETAPAVSPDLVIAVGAESQPLPSSIARGSSASTVARGPSTNWMTRPEAVGALGL